MGANKRYVRHFDRLLDDRVLATLAAKGGLQCLTDHELALDYEPMTIDPDPKPVLVWVRFYDQAVRIRGTAHRWTQKAVGVKFTAGGKQYATWVWSDAVDPDPEPRVVPDSTKYGS